MLRKLIISLIICLSITLFAADPTPNPIFSLTSSNNISTLNTLYAPNQNYATNVSGIAEEYCHRASIVSPAARQFIHNWVNGQNGINGLSVTNLVDFAFFRQGLNTPFGNPISLVNTGTIVGTIGRLPGGFQIYNRVTQPGAITNYFYFTNVASTITGQRTLVVWFAGDPQPSGVLLDAGLHLFEYRCAGSGSVNTIVGLYNGGGGFVPYVYNGSVQDIGGTAMYPPSGIAINSPALEQSIACAMLASGNVNTEVAVKMDWGFGNSPQQNPIFDYITTDQCPTAPTIFNFGYKLANNTGGTCAIIIGYAFYNIALTTNQMMSIDALVPRIGLVVQGDSKSIDGNVNWSEYFSTTRATWGLMSKLTNSSAGGIPGSATNNPSDNIEKRFAIDLQWKTNAMFPIIWDSIRSGHNDFLGTNSATQLTIDAGFNAITNMWANAHSNGWKTIGWTIDRTSVTVSSAGQSNLLEYLNGKIRAFSGNCDVLADAETFWVGTIGRVDPWANTSVYDSGVTFGIHEKNAPWLLGTNLLNSPNSPSLGYEWPPQQALARDMLSSTENFPVGGILLGNGAGFTNNIVWKTANYQMNSLDSGVLLGANLSVTMAPPASVIGKLIWIQCSGSGTNAIYPNNGETFNGSAGTGLTKLTNTATGKLTALYSNGTNWWIYFLNN